MKYSLILQFHFDGSDGPEVETFATTIERDARYIGVDWPTSGVQALTEAAVYQYLTDPRPFRAKTKWEWLEVCIVSQHAQPRVWATSVRRSRMETEIIIREAPLLLTQINTPI